MPVKVFISYSHDSDAHDARVRKLADSLRKHGVECIIDQYEQNWLQGDAALCMQRWIEEADFVLVVCTETYKRRIEKKESLRKGQGAKWEGLLIRNSLYDNDSANTKFVPVLIDPKDKAHRPLPLIGANYYVVNDQAGFNRLYWYIRGHNPDQAPPLGEEVELPEIPQRPTFDRPGPSLVNRVVGPSTVPTPSATFIKRPNITRQIHDALQKNPEQAVVRQAVTRAMGGYGKTVAAILYAHEYAAAYPGGRFFLPVESGDLVAALASLITPLGLTSQNNPAADAALVSKTLRDDEPSLLILDNVASKAAWEAMQATGLVPRGQCRVLITTRDEAIDPAEAIKVGRLEPGEAREVYRLFCEHRRKTESDPAKRAALPAALPTDTVADEITVWLGGLAVSVAAVAAYMKLKRHLSWEAYWNGDGKQLRGLKNTPVSELPDVRPEVAQQLGIEGKTLEAHRRTLRVIDNAMDTLPAPERRAVEYAALLPHDMAPGIWLETLLDSDGDLTLTTDPDDDQPPARAVLRHLDELDILLPGGEGGQLLSLHRLWHTRVNERTAAEKRDTSPLWLAIAACAGARRETIVGVGGQHPDRGVNNPAPLTDKSLIWELAPLAAVCTILWQKADSALEMGDSEKSHLLASAAAGIGVWLAAVLRYFGRLHEAAQCLMGVETHEVAIAAAHGFEKLAACYSNLATIQRSRGVYSGDKGARHNIERAISIIERSCGEHELTIVTMRSNLAAIQQDQGDLAGARATMEYVIRTEERLLGDDHFTLAITYNNFAMLLNDLDEVDEAIKYKTRSIDIEKKRLTGDHPQLGVSYNNLAKLQRKKGELAAARNSVDDAIRIARSAFGDIHPDVASACFTLAMIQRDQAMLFASAGDSSAVKRELDAARKNVELAIQVQEATVGLGHPAVARMLFELAQIQQVQRDTSGARTSMERAIAIGERLGGVENPLLASLYNRLADIAITEGKIREAVALWRKARDILLKALGPDHPSTKHVLAMLRKSDPLGTG